MTPTIPNWNSTIHQYTANKNRVRIDNKDIKYYDKFYGDSM